MSDTNPQDEVWTRPSRKFGRSKEGRLRQVAEIPFLAPHFPRLLKVNRQNGVLTLARPNFERRASLADLDVSTLRRLKAELRAVYTAMYDNSIAYAFSPDGFDVVSTRASSGWRIWIDGWNHASRHKVREAGSKKTAYFIEMEAEQLQKIEEYFAPFEVRDVASMGIFTQAPNFDAGVQEGEEANMMNDSHEPSKKSRPLSTTTPFEDGEIRFFLRPGFFGLGCTRFFCIFLGPRRYPRAGLRRPGTGVLGGSAYGRGCVFLEAFLMQMPTMAHFFSENTMVSRMPVLNELPRRRIRVEN